MLEAEGREKGDVGEVIKTLSERRWTHTASRNLSLREGLRVLGRGRGEVWLV